MVIDPHLPIGGCGLGNKGMIGLVLGIVVVILVAVGLFGVGWVTGEIDAGLGIKMDVSYGLWGYSMEFGGESEDGSYSDEGIKDTDLAKNIGTPRIVVILGMVLAIVMIIMGFLAMQGKMSGKLAMIVGILAGVIILVGAIMAVGTIKNELTEDLPEGTGYSLGNGGMFYITLVAAILAFVAGAMMKGLGKADEPAAMPPPTMDAAQPPVQ